MKEAHLWRYKFYGQRRLRMYITDRDSDGSDILILDALPDRGTKKHVMDVIKCNTTEYNMDRIRNGQDHVLCGTLFGRDYKGTSDIDGSKFDFLMKMAKRHEASLKHDRITRDIILRVFDSLTEYQQEPVDS